MLLYFYKSLSFSLCENVTLCSLLGELFLNMSTNPLSDFIFWWRIFYINCIIIANDQLGHLPAKGVFFMFTHLHVHTGYSILDGHSRIDKLVNKAKEMGQSALAITDHGYMYGVIPFYNALHQEWHKQFLGVELYHNGRYYL